MRPDGFNVLHDPELHRAVAKSYEHCITETRKEAAFWKAKYESWSYRIPDARKQNLKHGLQLDSMHMDKIAAQKEASAA